MLPVNPMPRTGAGAGARPRRAPGAHHTRRRLSSYSHVHSCQSVTWWEGPSLGAMAISSCLSLQEMRPQQSKCIKEILWNQNKSRILEEIPRIRLCALHLEFKKLRNYSHQQRKKRLESQFYGRQKDKGILPSSWINASGESYLKEGMMKSRWLRKCEVQPYFPGIPPSTK